MTTKIELTEDHIEEVLNKEVMVGSDQTKDGKRKKFTYNAWLEIYAIFVDGTPVESAQNTYRAVTALLKRYNEL